MHTPKAETTFAPAWPSWRLVRRAIILILVGTMLVPGATAFADPGEPPVTTGNVTITTGDDGVTTAPVTTTPGATKPAQSAEPSFLDQLIKGLGALAGLIGGLCQLFGNSDCQNIAFGAKEVISGVTGVVALFSGDESREAASTAAQPVSAQVAQPPTNGAKPDTINIPNVPVVQH